MTLPFGPKPGQNGSWVQLIVQNRLSRGQIPDSLQKANLEGDVFATRKQMRATLYSPAVTLPRENPYSFSKSLFWRLFLFRFSTALR
jgi:hypothetical protein